MSTTSRQKCLLVRICSGCIRLRGHTVIRLQNLDWCLSKEALGASPWKQVRSGGSCGASSREGESWAHLVQEPLQLHVIGLQLLCCLIHLHGMCHSPCSPIVETHPSICRAASISLFMSRLHNAIICVARVWGRQVRTLSSTASRTVSCCFRVSPIASPMPFRVPMPFSMLSRALSCLAFASSQS